MGKDKIGVGGAGRERGGRVASGAADFSQMEISNFSSGKSAAK
jgi:hypothetical protein